MNGQFAIFLVLAGVLSIAFFSVSSFQDVTDFSDTPRVYPFTTIVNGTLPEAMPIVYLAGATGNGYIIYYKQYFPGNDSWTDAVSLNGELRNLDGLQIYGDKIAFTGKNFNNQTWFKIVYSNGTTFKDWVNLYSP